MSRVLSDSEESGESKTVRDSQLSASTLNKRWLKSRSAGRDLSLATNFDSEELEEPNIPSDFDAKYGLDKNRFTRTAYPILSRRETYEDYGKAHRGEDSIKTEEISFDFSSSKDKTINPAKTKMTSQSMKLEESTLKTLQNTPRSQLDSNIKLKTDKKLKKETKGIPPKTKLDQPITSGSIKQNFESIQPDENNKNKMSDRSEKIQYPESPLQAPKFEVKVSSNNSVINATQTPTTEKIFLTTKESKIKRIAQESLSYVASHIFKSRQNTSPNSSSPVFTQQQIPSSLQSKTLKPVLPQQILPKLVSPQNPTQNTAPVQQPLPKPVSLQKKPPPKPVSPQQQPPPKPVPQQQQPPPKLVLQQQLQTSKPVSQQQQPPPKSVPSEQQPSPKSVPPQQQPSPKPVLPQQQPPPKTVSQQQKPPSKPVSPQQQPPPKPVLQQQQPTSKTVSQQQQPSPKPVSPLQQPPPKSVPPQQQQSPKPVSPQQQPQQQPLPKPVSTQQQPPPKSVPSQQQPPPISVPPQQQPSPKPVSPQQQPPPKSVSSQQQPPPKPVSPQQQPQQQPLPKPVSTQQQPPPKSVPSQQQPPPISVPPQQQPSPKPVSPQQQPPPKSVSSQQQPPPKSVPPQQQPPPKSVSPQQQPSPKLVQSQQAKPVPSQQSLPKLSPSQQQTQKQATLQNPPFKPVLSQQPPTKSVSPQHISLKPVFIAQPTTKTVPPKPVPSKPTQKTVSPQESPLKSITPESPNKPIMQQTPQQPPKLVPPQRPPPKPVPKQKPPQLLVTQTSPPKTPQQTALKPVLPPPTQQPSNPVFLKENPKNRLSSRDQSPKPGPPQLQPTKPEYLQQQTDLPTILKMHPQSPKKEPQPLPTKTKPIPSKPGPLQPQILKNDIQQQTLDPSPSQQKLPNPQNQPQNPDTQKQLKTSPTQQLASTSDNSYKQSPTKNIQQSPTQSSFQEKTLTQSTQQQQTPTQAASQQQPPTETSSKQLYPTQVGSKQQSTTQSASQQQTSSKQQTQTQRVPQQLSTQAAFQQHSPTKTASKQQSPTQAVSQQQSPTQTASKQQPPTPAPSQQLYQTQAAFQQQTPTQTASKSQRVSQHQLSTQAASLQQSSTKAASKQQLSTQLSAQQQPSTQPPPQLSQTSNPLQQIPKVSVNNNAIDTKTEMSTYTPDPSDSKLNLQKLTVTKSGVVHSTQKPSSDLATSQPSIVFETTSEQNTFVASSEKNPSHLTEKASSYSMLEATTIHNKAAVQTVEGSQLPKISSSIPPAVATPQSVFKDPVTSIVAATDSLITAEGTVDTTSQRHFTESFSSKPLQWIRGTQLPTEKVSETMTTQPQQFELIDQTTLSQPSSFKDSTTAQTPTEKTIKIQPSSQIATHPSVPKSLTVASFKKKTTVRAYDKILNKAGDIIKPKSSTKTTTEKVPSTTRNNQEKKEINQENKEISNPTPSMIKELKSSTPASPKIHEITSKTFPVIETTSTLLTEVQTISETLPTVRQENLQNLSQKSTPVQVTEQEKVESTLPKTQYQTVEKPSLGNFEEGTKLNRPKGRRAPRRIFLKPPPEDWPQPEAVQGAKEVPVPPEFTANMPPMGTYIDSGKRKSGYKADSFVSPPYMGHVKIDLVPAPEKPATNRANETLPSASTKWRLRGRKDRPNYGSFQKSGLYVSLTMKPSDSQFPIGSNITFITPTMRSSRPHRTYINFRQRGPMNVGRLFGPVPPPPPPFPQPQPPPQHFHGPPFNQPPFPQHPQFPHPPFPPFPRAPPPPPRFGPPHHPRFNQPRPPPPPPPFAPFPQGPPPPPPHFQRGPPPPHPQYSPPFPPAAPPTPPSDPPQPPPSPYPTGVVFPTVRPFYENIPTISPIDNVPAPWPRRQVYMGTYQPKTFIPRNFSAYKGPRRGRAYEQFGKADLRPKRVRLYDDLAMRGTPKSPIRRGYGYGVEFQTDVTRPPYVPGPMFVRKTWPTRGNRFGYEPYRRSSDRKRPFGGFGRFGADKPPVLGDFGQFKPYKRLDFEGKSVYNFSRPTRSYTFPPRLQMAIRNATYQRRSFRRFDRERFDRQNLGYIPSGTYKSFGLGDNIAHDHDYYGNLITRKGRIMNVQELKRFFTEAPMTSAHVVEPMEQKSLAPITKTMDTVTKVMKPVKEAMEPVAAVIEESLTAAPVVKEAKHITAAPVFESLDSEIVTVLPEETVKKLLEDFMRGKPQSKPVGMTAKEALRAAAREAIRDTEQEAYDRGEVVGGGLARRRKGGFRPRGERGRGRGRGDFRFGTGARNFRRAKRSLDDEEFLERQTRGIRDLRLSREGGAYLPGSETRSSRDWGSAAGNPQLRLRRFHPLRGKGRPMRWG